MQDENNKKRKIKYIAEGELENNLGEFKNEKKPKYENSNSNSNSQNFISNNDENSSSAANNTEEEQYSIDEIEDSLENNTNTYYNIAFLALIENFKSKNKSPLEIFKILGIEDQIDSIQDDVAWSILYQIAKFSNPWNVIRYFQREDFQNTKTRYRMEYLEDSMEEAVRLIKDAKRIIVLTGAGVSVSCGIPDFRSAGGVYDQIKSKYDLSDPQLLFDVAHLFQNPKPFFEFAKEIYPGNYSPSLAHNFIAYLEKEGKLLRNYTQNIDTLEDSAGIKRVIHCHGNFSTATCIDCNKTVQGSEIKDKIMNCEIPYCDECNNDRAFFKPNIVFFGEDLPNQFYEKIKKDKKKADLLIIMGSSLRVEPVANIPEKLKDIPQILINREIVCPNHEFDINLLGEADEIVRELLSHLGWDVPINNPPSSIELSNMEEDENKEEYEFSNPNLDSLDLFNGSMSLFNFDNYDSNSCSSLDYFN